MEPMRKQFFHVLEQAHRQFHSLEVLVIAGAAVHPVIAAGIALGDYAGHVAWAAVHPQPQHQENNPNPNAEAHQEAKQSVQSEHSEQQQTQGQQQISQYM